MSEQTPPTGNAESADSDVQSVIGEARKYRKRAQTAEKNLTDLQQQLQEKDHQLAELEQTVAHLERASRVDQLLIEADAIDLESARLLTAMAIDQMPEPDAAEAVAELKRRKPYLFRAPGRASGAMSARPETTSRQDVTAAAAEQACATGHRTDLLRYLRLKRTAR